MTVDAGSTLTVGAGNSYAQSSGTTTVDGTLTAQGTGITVTGGKILGAGKLNANVTVGGEPHPASALVTAARQDCWLSLAAIRNFQPPA